MRDELTERGIVPFPEAKKSVRDDFYVAVDILPFPQKWDSLGKDITPEDRSYLSKGSLCLCADMVKCCRTASSNQLRIRCHFAAAHDNYKEHKSTFRERLGVEELEFIQLVDPAKYVHHSHYYNGGTSGLFENLMAEAYDLLRQQDFSPEEFQQQVDSAAQKIKDPTVQSEILTVCRSRIASMFSSSRAAHRANEKRGFAAQKEGIKHAIKANRKQGYAAQKERAKHQGVRLNYTNRILEHARSQFDSDRLFIFNRGGVEGRSGVCQPGQGDNARWWQVHDATGRYMLDLVRGYYLHPSCRSSKPWPEGSSAPLGARAERGVCGCTFPT